MGAEPTTKHARIRPSFRSFAACLRKPPELSLPELARFGDKIHWGAIYGSIARGEEGAESDIDLLIVGDVTTVDLLPALRRVERQLGREVNVKRYSEREFRNKMRQGDHFLKSVVKGKLVSLVGSPDELEKVTRRT